MVLLFGCEQVGETCKTKPQGVEIVIGLQTHLVSNYTIYFRVGFATSHSRPCLYTSDYEFEMRTASRYPRHIHNILRIPLNYCSVARVRPSSEWPHRLLFSRFGHRSGYTGCRWVWQTKLVITRKLVPSWLFRPASEPRRGR